MKTITIVAEQVSDQSLAAVLPPKGVVSVAVSPSGSVRRDPTAEYQAFRNPNRFAPRYRVDVIVDDEAVETLFDGISFAYGAGLFSDAEAWVAGPALALTA